MKTKFFLLGAMLSVAAAVALAAENNDRVQVNFDHPENYTDASDHFGARDATDSRYLPELRDYFQRSAPKFLGEGEKLIVTFTDIDLAGEFEPWRGPRAQDVRIIKPIYIPRLKFDFRVTDATGNVVKSGHANVTDLNFQDDLSAISIGRDEPLFYEKQLLSNWMRRELPGPDKKK